MQVALHNKVKIYNLTAGKSLPEWLADKKKNKKAAGGENRIELLHGFEFPHFTRCLFRSPNGTYMFCAGDYPPRLKCYDVNELSMKFSFNADMPILGGCALSPDYRKFALRGEGRTVTLHNSCVIIDRVSVPHPQRGITYHWHTGELLSYGSTRYVSRLSLEVGSFLEPFSTDAKSGINSIDFFQGHGLIMMGGENGTVEAWDSRQAKRANVLIVSPGSENEGRDGKVLPAHPDIGEGNTITHVCCDDSSSSGLTVAVGTSGGSVVLYDIRSKNPLLVKNHYNGLPIVRSYFFKGGSGDDQKIISADARTVKIWDRKDGMNFTSLDAPAEIYDFELFKSKHNMAVPPYRCEDSGILCLACDMPRIQVHFIPQLGVAPRWCSFLDSITEELEEKASNVVYDDYKFMTKEELQEKLGASVSQSLTASDISGGKVRPYMHGFFIEAALYRELMAVADPGGFDRFAENQRKKQRERRTENRISTFKRKAPVEGEEEHTTKKKEGTAEKDDQKEGEEGKGETRNNILLQGAMHDKRFAARLQDNKDFSPDQNNPEFQRLLQVVEQRKLKVAARHLKYQDAQFNIVPDEEERKKGGEGESSEVESHDEDGGHNDDDDMTLEKMKQLQFDRQGPRKKTPAESSTKNTDEKKPQAQTKMYVAKENVDTLATDQHIHESRKREKEKKLSIGDRLKKVEKRRIKQ